MRKLAFASIVAIATAMTATPSWAAWFARLDSANKLVVTGIATDKDGVASTVTLTCDAGRFGLEVLTRFNAQDDDLPIYTGTKIVLAYKTKEGEVRKMGVEGTPKVFVGDVLGIVAALSVEQSQAVYRSIARGYRLDVELIHPELIHDVGLKQVFSEGFVQALLGISEHCEGFK